MCATEALCLLKLRRAPSLFSSIRMISVASFLSWRGAGLRCGQKYKTSDTYKMKAIQYLDVTAAAPAIPRAEVDRRAWGS
jgi:hypothetical protein